MISAEFFSLTCRNKDSNVPVPNEETWCKNVYHAIIIEFNLSNSHLHAITDKNEHASHFVLYKNFSRTELNVLNFVDELSFECS